MGDALIVIDMQNDFLAQGGFYDRKSRGEIKETLAVPSQAQAFRLWPVFPDGFVDHVREAINLAEHKRMPVMYVRAVYDRKFRFGPRFLWEDNGPRADYPCKLKPSTNMIDTVGGTEPLVHLEWGAQLIEPILDHNPTPIDKHHFDAFFKTGLAETLRISGVDRVVLAGIETHVCVLATAISASINGFLPILLQDCVASANIRLNEPALEIVRDAFGQVKSMSEFFGKSTP